MPDTDDLIEKHARRTGIDASWLRKIMRVESGGNPNASTGSYKGLFQLSQQEFRRGGGSGSIYDPEQNTMAAANKIAGEKLRFQQKYGREANLSDIYMIHQQGEAGYAAHMANPDRAAWINMASTAEGQQKGLAWAKKAIWGNLTPQMKAKYGNVENVTSQNFIDDWGGRIEGASPSQVMAKQRQRHEGIPTDTVAPQEKKVEENWTPYQPHIPDFVVPDLVPNIPMRTRET